MMPRLTKAQRKLAIAWILDRRFGFSELDKFKRDQPHEWRAEDNGMLRGIHKEGLRLRQRLHRISDRALNGELAREIHRTDKIERMKAEGFAHIEREEQENARHIRRGKALLAAATSGGKRRGMQQQGQAAEGRDKTISKTYMQVRAKGIADRKIISETTKRLQQSHDPKLNALSERQVRRAVERVRKRGQQPS